MLGTIITESALVGVEEDKEKPNVTHLVALHLKQTFKIDIFSLKEILINTFRKISSLLVGDNAVQRSRGILGACSPSFNHLGKFHIGTSFGGFFKSVSYSRSR